MESVFLALALLPWRLSNLRTARDVSRRSPDVQEYANAGHLATTTYSWLAWGTGVVLLFVRATDAREPRIFAQFAVIVGFAMVFVAIYRSHTKPTNSEAGIKHPFSAAGLHRLLPKFSCSFLLAGLGLVADVWLVVSNYVYVARN